MTVVAECAFPPGSFPLGSFPLGETIRIPAGSRIEVERVVPTDQGMLPYVLVESDDPDELVVSLREQSAVASVEVLDRHESAVLLRIHWTDEENVVRWLGAADAAILDLVGDEDGWLLRLRSEYDVVEAFDAYCREWGTAFELRRLYEPGDGEQLLGPQVTPVQRETLRLAYDLGYYEEPRETTLGDLAIELGVGERAVSRRLHRGLQNLLATTFGDRPGRPGA